MNTWKHSAVKNERIENLLKNTNYEIIQLNGQRIYSPSASSGILPPPRGTEIFIGNLSPDLYEDEIIPLFRQTGPIYSLRLMLDFFGRNRGYGFISYFHSEDAHKAVEMLNNYKIRNRTRIAVSMSVDNRRLFVGNIPRTIPLAEIRAILQKYVEGITDVILYYEPYNENFNRGFVFVEFENHRLAAIARRQLSPGNLLIKDQAIFVDWAEPLPLINPQVMKQVTKLYLSNVPPKLSCDQLKYLLFELVGSTHILKVHKINDYAFVHFTLRKYAEEALIKLSGLVIMNRRIGVEWARPAEYSKHHRLGKLPDNYCKSVPPSMRRMVMQTLDTRNKINKRCSSSESSGIGECANDELVECKFDELNFFETLNI